MELWARSSELWARPGPWGRTVPGGAPSPGEAGQAAALRARPHTLLCPSRLNSIDVKYQMWKLGVVFTDNVSSEHGSAAEAVGRRVSLTEVVQSVPLMRTRREGPAGMSD